MAWKGYKVIFRLRSTLHVGWGKVGNIQRTRPYITGRVLWGALTMRLTRDMAHGGSAATDSRAYQRVGDDVNRTLAFTYFYPALKSESGYKVEWPWSDENGFRHRFLSSYASTALSYPEQSAETGMLHEVEFISPNALDNGQSVFLQGYIFEQDGCTLVWRDACTRMQIGGERGYGWGAIDCVHCDELDGSDIYDGLAVLNDSSVRPTIHLSALAKAPCRLLAHTKLTDISAEGNIEPLVGREWRSNNRHYRYAGQHVAFNHVCFTPGSVIREPMTFRIGPYGIWEKVDVPAAA